MWVGLDVELGKNRAMKKSSPQGLEKEKKPKKLEN